MAYLAELAGLHIIIGAFLAGQFVRKEIMDEKLYHVIHDRFFGLSYGFLVPIFFVSLSFHLHFPHSAEFVIFTTVLILMAIVGKLVGSGLGIYPFRKSVWESTIVGFGLNGRGAVELVIASVIIKLSDNLVSEGVISEPLLTDMQFSALILMAFITTFIAPLSLKWSVMKACSRDEQTLFCNRWDKMSSR
jgi:Kef-type K+ transport system membrane component KefB